MENYKVTDQEGNNPSLIGKTLTKEQVIKEFSSNAYTIGDGAIKQMVQMGVLESTTTPKLIKLSITDSGEFHGITRNDGRKFTPDMKKACEKAITNFLNGSNGSV